MKNSMKYANKVNKLYRTLKQKHPKVKSVVYDDPAEALVYAIISEYTSASAAQAVVKRIKEHFVNLSDLRVSRKEEIGEVVGDSVSDLNTLVRVLMEALGHIFTRYDTVSLVWLKEQGKRQGKKELEQIEGISKFAVNYCFLTAIGGHTIPMTRQMIEYLRAFELVNPKSNDEDIEGFLERQISATEGYTFYSLLRQESEKSHKKVEKLLAETAKKADAENKKVKKAKAPAKKVAKKKVAKKKSKTKKTKRG